MSVGKSNTTKIRTFQNQDPLIIWRKRTHNVHGTFIMHEKHSKNMCIKTQTLAKPQHYSLQKAGKKTKMAEEIKEKLSLQK